MIVVLLMVSAFVCSDTVFLCEVLNGDNSLLNLLLLSVTAGAVLFSIPAMRRLPGKLAEAGRLSLQPGTAERTSKLLVPGVNDRLLTGDLADRLRSGCRIQRRWMIWIGLGFVVHELAGLFGAGGDDAGRSFLQIQTLIWVACAPGLMIFLWVQVWLMRRFRLWSDFVMPCSRLEFWRAVRVAVFRDLRWSYLLMILLPPAMLPIGIALGDIKAGQPILPLCLCGFSVLQVRVCCIMECCVGLCLVRGLHGSTICRLCRRISCSFGYST